MIDSFTWLPGTFFPRLSTRIYWENVRSYQQTPANSTDSPWGRNLTSIGMRYCTCKLNFFIDKTSDVDRHRFDADPDPKFLCLCRFCSGSGLASKWCRSMRILPQVSYVLENPNFFTFSQGFANLHCFIFLINVKCVIILTRYKLFGGFFRKKKFIFYICWKIFKF